MFACHTGLIGAMRRIGSVLSLAVCGFSLHAANLCQHNGPESLQTLVRQTQQQPAPGSQLHRHLQAFISPAELSQVKLTADGQWLWYWRRQGSQYWLIRSRGDGEEQVVLKQRSPFSQWQPNADNSGIWLAEADQVLFFDLRRRQLQKIWSAGQPLPGQRSQTDLRHLRVLQLQSVGPGFAVFHQYQAGQHQYWQLRHGHTAQLLTQHPLPLQSLWFNPDGQLSAVARLDGPAQQTSIWQWHHQQWQQSLLCQPAQFCRLWGQQQASGDLWLVSAPVPVARTAGTAADDGAPQQLTRLQADGRQIAAADWLTAPQVAGLPADPVSVLLDRHGQLLALSHWTHRLQWQAAPGWQALLDQLQQQWPTASMSLQLSADQRRLLVGLSYSDQPQRDYYLLTLQVQDDLAASPAALTQTQLVQTQLAQTQLVQTQPADAAAAQRRIRILRQQALALQPSQAAPANPAGSPAQLWCYRAADGRQLAAYLYLPTGRALAQSPLVLYPHGGPWQQSTPQYDPIMQMLVAEGYIVLQPNYRGSTGYGAALLHGAADLAAAPLLADLTSAADQLLQQGIGAASQQLLLGHSFGGYLALQALAAQPKRWRAVLALAAPLDLTQIWPAYVQKHDHDWTLALRPLSLQLPDLGVPLQDTAWQQKLAAEAIPQRLQQLSTPLYLWAAGQDDRIPTGALQQWTQQLQSTQAASPVLQFYLDPVSQHWPGSSPQQRMSRAALFYLIWQSSRAQLQAAALLQALPPQPAMAYDFSIEQIEEYLQQIQQVMPQGKY